MFLSKVCDTVKINATETTWDLTAHAENFRKEETLTKKLVQQYYEKVLDIEELN